MQVNHFSVFFLDFFFFFFYVFFYQNNDSFAYFFYSPEKRDADSEVVNDVMDAVAADKRVFRYGRSPSVFRYGKRGPAVFRYGKRGQGVFRYGKREDDFENDDTMKRLFRWGKRDNDDNKRIFRWGKRSDDLDDLEEMKRMVFRYGKRADYDDYYANDDDKRRVFQFGKRNTGKGNVQSDLVLRSDSPHVPFRFGKEEK
jgi:hypothetical protein